MTDTLGEQVKIFMKFNFHKSFKKPRLTFVIIDILCQPKCRHVLKQEEYSIGDNYVDIT